MMDWIQELQGKRARKYSQGGQDGIIKAIFDQIGTTNKFCVEFGFNSTSLTGGTGSNTARLILDEGWKGVLFDSDHENPSINLHKVKLTSDDMGKVFNKHGVPNEPDYVSIDVDGDDLWLMEGMLWDGFRPRVISVEYNSVFPITESVTVKEDCPKWENDAAYGASLLALNTVALDYGYHLVAVEPRLDLFFVRDVPRGICELEKYCELVFHEAPSVERQGLFVGYPSLEPVDVSSYFEKRSGTQPDDHIPLMP